MEQTFPLFGTNPSIMNGCEERVLLHWLNRLNLKKASWEQFLQKVENPLSVSRLVATENGRSLLHLAVLDDQLSIVQSLAQDPSLKFRRDLLGLSPIELAQLLDRKEVLEVLQARSEALPQPKLPLSKRFESLSHPIFETREGFEQVLACTAKAKREDQIPAEKIWMGIYFDKEIQKGIHPSVSIRRVNPEMGYGVFAEKRIPPCTYVGEYTGVIQERNPKRLKEKKYCLRYTMWGEKKNFTIDAEEKGNFTRFINHSATPSLGLQSIYWRGIPRMIFVALKEIEEGEQLMFHYGPLFWKHLNPPIEISQ